MSYVDAGYAIVLSSLAIYTAWVLRRHRILGRALGPDRSTGDQWQ